MEESNLMSSSSINVGDIIFQLVNFGFLALFIILIVSYFRSNKKSRNQLTLGGGWNQYNGRHFGEIIWAKIGVPKNFRYYNLTAVKKM